MKHNGFQILRDLLLLIALCFNILIVGVCTYLFIEYKPVVMKIKDAHYKVTFNTDISLKTKIPLSAVATTELAIPLNCEVPLSLPINTVVEIPIDQTVNLKIDKDVMVRMFHKFNINKGVNIQASVPIDTVIKTKIFGMDADLPIKTDFPVDIAIPLREDIIIDETLPLHLAEAVPVSVKKIVKIPINHNLQAILPLKQNIKLPLTIDVTSVLTVDKKVPCVIGVDISLN